jgi:hypothetical protein
MGSKHPAGENGSNASTIRTRARESFGCAVISAGDRFGIELVSGIVNFFKVLFFFGRRA